ncbi:MAG: 3-deoxy-manno-octulosonate cytidylyltransferase [Candidatus Omnitrophica bacterium]|nr:3-deoxy-manno-octulosonate cytidylyltransferase [Candidatus Omnitrophota bacterium]
MEVIGVIPARHYSRRLPGKLLKLLLGKPLLQWTWESAKKSSSLDRLIIACDSEEIKNVAQGFGAEVVLTSEKHTSGTDRIAEAVRDVDVNFVINIQADEPLIHYSAIDTLVEELKNNPKLVMVTLKKEINEGEEVNNPNVVKVVTDREGFALYFSRFPIPYRRDNEVTPTYYKHIGIYGYAKDFLYIFKSLPPSSLEKAEKLEQLRALEAGYRIKVVTTQFDSWGVDTEEDFKKVEWILTQRGYRP